MDDSLIAAIQPFNIETPWGVYVVRPPTVREALTILASYRDALEDAPVNTGVFFETLADWLPERMVKTMRKSNRHEVVSWVINFVNAGVPTFHSETDGEYEGGGGWTSVVTDFVSVYPYTVEEVLNERFPVFLIMAAGIKQVRARQAIELLRVKGIQYTKDNGERQAEIDNLVSAANYPTLTAEARQKLADEKQAKALEQMSVMFSHHRTENIGKA